MHSEREKNEELRNQGKRKKYRRKLLLRHWPVFGTVLDGWC